MFHRHQLNMVIIAGQNLILLITPYNTLEYTVMEYILYYILFTAEQLKMYPNKFTVFVRGRIYPPQDEIYKLLYRYVHHIK
ncbi:MAG: DUF3822 family protein [Flavobacteriales bacterium]